MAGSRDAWTPSEHHIVVLIREPGPAQAPDSDETLLWMR
jgi:hypothetical protein